MFVYGMASDKVIRLPSKNKAGCLSQFQGAKKKICLHACLTSMCFDVSSRIREPNQLTGSATQCVDSGTGTLVNTGELAEHFDLLGVHAVQNDDFSR